ncbi:hydrogenase expression/formation protein [Nitrogeniibacter mangrovi]|uniref:Hydrogenase expression/formation protein n=1 Tax=Nitrogeniibacter mangrovi TaxID=2016596 RepID=A0A6C1B204_9RHOO|nr:hydrogenase expression/formation protein [Nitrogeniibacter mangrovi]QID16858.1 hydrogenase expression/formation protein [Nitrogeniibacter mangrovi]
MKSFPLPVVALGPGSQEEDEALEYIAAPGEMTTFQTPMFPDSADAQARSAALGVLEDLLGRMQQMRFGRNVEVDLSGLEAPARKLVNEALGEGEVSATVAGERPVRVQETVFAGLWRVVSEGAGDSDRIDRVEAGPMPSLVLSAGRDEALKHIPAPAPGEGVINAPAVLTELNEAVGARRPGAPAHIINLTLLPMSPEDLDYLGASLGVGPVVILSRGYGNCRITRTRLRDTWWVQYFNSTDKLILNTIEVTDLPDVAPAAREDVEDSIERLAEWIDALRQD